MKMNRTRSWFKTSSGRIIAYFLQGLLLIAPVFVTFYALFSIFDWLDSKVNLVFEKMFHFYFPGLGIAAMFVLITIIGVIGSIVFLQPLLHVVDAVMEKTPVVKDIYSSLKDFFSAFISNKKKFDKPVLFEFGKGSGVYKMGFITQDDLKELNILDKVAVYAPLSYNLSGLLYIVNRDQIQVLNDVSAGDVMKFVVSGGVTEIEEEHGAPLPPPTA